MDRPDYLRRARRGVVRWLPSPARRALAVPYNRYHRIQADREFRERDLPDLATGAGAPRHVVVVVVDCLRDDVIGPDLTPFLDGLDGRGAVSPSPWTFPAVSSLVTGKYPHEHGAIRGSDAVSEELTVPPELEADHTLTETLAGAGYETYGAFGLMMPFLALSGRFHRHLLYRSADADRILGDYGQWVEDRERTFAYLHLSDPHLPVDPPAEYWRKHDVDPDVPDLETWAYADVSEWSPADFGPDARRPPGPVGLPDDPSDAEYYREHRARLYRAAVDYVDDRLAALHDRLSHLDGDVAFVVTADHGEGFWEHAALDATNFVDERPSRAARHGGTPYEPVVRVPLLADGVPVPESGGELSLVDLAPTLLDLAGLGDAMPTIGRSLVDTPPTERVVLSESTRYGHERKAAYLDGWKAIVSRGDEATVGFSLPGEERTTLPEEVRERLFDTLPRWPDGSRPDEAVSGIARDRLEDLGYV